MELTNLRLFSQEPQQLHHDASHIRYFVVEAGYKGNLVLNPREVHPEGTRFYTANEIQKMLASADLFTPPIYHLVKKPHI